MNALLSKHLTAQALFFSFFTFLVCCTQQPAELSPKEKFETYHKNFLSSWSEANPVFESSSEDLQIEISEKNASAQLYSANLSFPLNWTEI